MPRRTPVLCAMLNEDLLQLAESGDLPALAELDCQGLLLGAEESLADYAARLRCLEANIAKLDGALGETGSYTLEDLKVERDQRMPAATFAEPRGLTQRLFGFAIDWVPGFFIDSGGLLFGGCSYYFYPDFFALFTIRRAFAERERWLIYRRTELLAHELCHIARIGLASHEYEEVFAYRTSGSRFRRAVGGMFRSPADSHSFLLSAFLILLARLAQIGWFPNLPQWPFWLPFLGCVVFQFGRHGLTMRRFARACAQMATLAGDQALPVLFRCTDAELRAVARQQDPAELRAWIDGNCEDSWRWRVIRHRFLAPEPPQPQA